MPRTEDDLARVRRIVAETLGVEASRVEPELRLTDLADLDSLSLVEIGSALDAEFGIHVPGEALSEALTPQDLSEIVARTRAT